MISPALLSAVVPHQLPNRLSTRYRGGGMDSALEAFSPEDQAGVRTLYTFLEGLYSRWLEVRELPQREAVIRQELQRFLAPPINQLARRLGTASGTQPGTAPVQKALHDIRGGALTALGLYAHLVLEEPADGADPTLIRAAVFLARDHAKMMRNAIPDLDPERRILDEAEDPHAMAEVVEKWHRHRFLQATGEEGWVAVECSYSGWLASCCLEASAVDRLIYNYMNNAVRFSSGDEIRLEIYPTPHGPVRWVVMNSIDERQRRWLENEVGPDLRPLFRGGITRGGRGVGLSNCADFVAAAFGLVDGDEALTHGHLGAVVQDDMYMAWAHWPALHSDP